MWSVINTTPFAADRGFQRDHEGREVWIVCVRAAFDVRADGSTAVSENQDPVSVEPIYTGEPGRSSLRSDTDIVLRKQATDVLLIAHAHAPGGRPATAVDVRMRVDKTVKTARIIGNRRWSKAVLGVSASPPEPFRTMPLVYERAFGGPIPGGANGPTEWDVRNPVGTGFAPAGASADGLALPNVENPKALLASPKNRPAPVGFGPIAPDWVPRRDLAGTYDEKWMKSRQPLPPEDLDERFFQCAPEDQQVRGMLHGGEEVELQNLSPGGLLRFRLPRVFLSFETDFGGSTAEHRAALHTVVLQPEVPRVVLVYQTALECQGREDRLRGTTIRQKVLVPLGGPQR